MMLQRDVRGESISHEVIEGHKEIARIEGDVVLPRVGLCASGGGSIFKLLIPAFHVHHGGARWTADGPVGTLFSNNTISMTTMRPLAEVPWLPIRTACPEVQRGQSAHIEMSPVGLGSFSNHIALTIRFNECCWFLPNNGRCKTYSMLWRDTQ